MTLPFKPHITKLPAYKPPAVPPGVERVIYPWLDSHPQQALAKEQMEGGGGVVTFLIEGGLAKARPFLEACRIFALAESLGGV